MTLRQLLPPPPPGPPSGDAFELYVVATRPAPPERPWVMANMVAGVDGSATVKGRVGDLSAEPDKRLFRLLRSLADVILVGATTVREEGYGPARPNDERRRRREERGQAPVPTLAVVTASLDLDWSSSFFTAAEARPVVITGAASDLDRRARAGEVADVVVAGEERVDLGVALALLRGRGTGVVLTEGGPLVLAELAAAGLLDELCLTVAPTLGGDRLRILADGVVVGLRDLTLASVCEDSGHLFLRYLATPGEDGPR